jgi:hypothetical protein
MFEAEDHSDTIKQLPLFQEENILLNGSIQDKSFFPALTVLP